MVILIPFARRLLAITFCASSTAGALLRAQTGQALAPWHNRATENAMRLRRNS